MCAVFLVAENGIGVSTVRLSVLRIVLEIFGTFVVLVWNSVLFFGV